MNKGRAVEEQQLKAITIFSTHYPYHQEYIVCLYLYGDLLRSSGRKAKAITILEAVLQLCIHEKEQEMITRCQSELQQLRQ